MSHVVEQTERTLTPEQQAALGFDGVSIALSAGAGCGKTFVLTERFLRHLDDEGEARCGLGRLVALTFTDKAARELRDRVRRACRARMTSGGVEAAYWRSVVRGLEAAPIGTFHAFCGELLRRFPIEAGVEPGFVIVEESIAPSLREQALADCIRGWLAGGDDDFHALAVERGIPGARDLLARMIALRTRGDLRTWATLDAGTIAAGWRDAWSSRILPLMVERLADSARPYLDTITRHECTHPKMRERIAFLCEAFPTLTAQTDPGALLAEIHEQARVQGGGNKTHWPSADVYESVKVALTGLRKEIESVSKLTWDETATRLAAESAGRLSRLALQVIDACERVKRAQGMLDFDDLLLRVRDLLLDPPDSVRSWLERSVGYVLIDEFQDTDPIQGQIVERLAGAGWREGRLFLVGDRKQSIYRFRGARPEVFDAFREQLPEAGRLQLTGNFRSRPEILDFVNALFAETFPGSEHLLRPGPGTPERSGLPAVEFLWAHDPAAEDSGAKVLVEERRRTEARWIARHLAARLAEGWIVRDRQTGAQRQASAGDIVLLFRSLNDAAAYESALVAEGLDYHVVGGAAFFGQQEVLDLINVLSAIEDPFDELALAATMRSPFGSVSDDGLYWLATSGHGDLARGLERWAEIPGLSDLDRHRAGRLRALMARWRELKDRVPISRLVERVLDDSGYEAALLGEFLGERRRANVRKLVRLARRYDAQGGLTLADLVARLRADDRDPPREDEAATTDEAGEAVRLMTIHQAKGLEFPIVVLPDLNRDIPQSRSPLTFHPELGPIVTTPQEDADGEPVQGESLGRLACRILDRAEEEAEARCVFYVATTRARDALVLSAGMTPEEPPRSPALKLLAERFDRATGAPRVELPKYLTAPAIRVIDLEPQASRAHSTRTGGPRSRLIKVFRLLEGVATEEQKPPRLAPDRPRFLDLDPALGLAPHAGRVDRLIRAILADPAALNAHQLPALARRLARVQRPAAPRRIEREALELLSGWLETGSALSLIRAGETRRAVPWSIAWPPDDPEPMVVRGCLDFVFRDQKGAWIVVNLAHPAAPPARERLRLRLSVLAARRLGLSSLDRGWTIRLGPGGQSLEEWRFEDEWIEQDLQEVLADATSPT